MVAKTVGEILKNHVALEVEQIDRLYLNGYIPGLQAPGMFARFVREILGMPIVSTTSVADITRNFVKGIEQFAKDKGLEIIRFNRKQRKDEITQEKLKCFHDKEGILFIGKAQEKASVFRTESRRTKTGERYPWVARGTAMPNHYYFYLVDEDFGPMFIKFCSYFPYGVKVCLNGHEWLKKQLEKEGIAYEALDNGILSCDDPERLQELCQELDEEKIEAVFHKWLERLPQPFSKEIQRCGYYYNLSIVQAEFALTQVFDRPMAGRQLFEEIIRDHLDLGRPENVQLIFDRRITKRTPSQFKTRIITQGVLPSLNVYYKWSWIKQYFKEGRALRTETVINNTKDFGIGRRLCNLPQLRKIGFQANRRLLNVEKLSHDCMIGESVFSSVTSPTIVNEQRASAMRFGDERVMALMNALCLFFTLPNGFRNRDLRLCTAQLLGKDPAEYKPGRMTYDLRRLPLHGLIERIDGSLRYQVTNKGIKVGAFFTKIYARVFRPALSCRGPNSSEAPPGKVPRGLRSLEKGLDLLLLEARMTA
ncbi:MAG: hypothetical protein QNK37_37945 [Acidobacteriota bacterium]|nr:hypothetical protein [Acidobacteriota bacterium]